MAQQTQSKEYKFRRIVSQLESKKGQNTELISLYIPSDKSISSVRQYLANEKSEAANIKSKQTRKNVTSALRSILSRLKYYDEIPSDGLAVFSGVFNDEQTVETIVLTEFQHPIPTFQYYCDDEFYLDPLHKINTLNEKSYGLIILDRRNAQIGVLSGENIAQKASTESRVPGKHTAGGQSQARFERLRQEAIQNFYDEVAALANESFFDDRHNLDGILVGGPSPTKEEFIQTEQLHHELQDKIIGSFNISDTTERGLTVLAEAGKEAIEKSEVIEKRNNMKQFFNALKKTEGNAVYGWNETLECLELGAVKTLFVSKEMQQVDIFECENGHSTLSKEKTNKCSICQSETGDVVTVDGSEYIQSLAESRGAEVKYIPTSFEKGEQLQSVFGGIAGILRYNPN